MGVRIDIPDQDQEVSWHFENGIMLTVRRVNQKSVDITLTQAFTQYKTIESVRGPIPNRSTRPEQE